jgi:hypothetical protein
MSNNFYALFEDDQILGIFDKTELNEELEEWYGSFTSVKFQDVKDSGIEWVHKIRYDDIRAEERESVLTLEQFYLNEIG